MIKILNPVRGLKKKTKNFLIWVRAALQKREWEYSKLDLNVKE